MLIEKNGVKYTITENINKWTVSSGSGSVSVAYEVPKDICKTEKEIKEYILSNDELF